LSNRMADDNDQHEEQPRELQTREKIETAGMPGGKKIRPPTWAIKAAGMSSEASKWFQTENTVKVPSMTAEKERRDIIKSMSRKTTSNSVLARWKPPVEEPTVDDRLQGKELDSLIRYKERRKKRVEQNNFQDFNNSTNDFERSIDKPNQEGSISVKSIMSNFQSSREPVFHRPNRIESRINAEIRQAAEKEADFRREKGVEKNRDIVQLEYTNGLAEKYAEKSREKHEKLCEIEAKLKELETSLVPMVEEEVVMNNTENKEDELAKKHEEQNDEQVSQMSDLTDQSTSQLERLNISVSDEAELDDKSTTLEITPSDTEDTVEPQASSTPDIDESQQSYELIADVPIAVPDTCTTTDTTSTDLEESISKLEETLQEINQDLENDSDHEASSPTTFELVKDAEEPYESNEQSEHEADLPPMVDDNEPAEQCDNSLITRSYLEPIISEEQLSPATEAQLCDQFEALANEVQPLDLVTENQSDKNDMDTSVSSITPSGLYNFIKTNQETIRSRSRQWNRPARRAHQISK